MITVQDWQVAKALKVTVHQDGVFTTPERIAMRTALQEFAIDDAKRRIRILMDELTDDARHDVITSYCVGCGSTDTNCTCQKDE